MAIKDQTHGKVSLKGLSTDTKPTNGIKAGSVFYETDTDNSYEFYGTSWSQKSTNGATDVHMASSDVIPANQKNVSYAFTSSAAAVGTTVDISQYVGCIIDISALTGETITITGLIGANQDVETDAILPIDIQTGALAAGGTALVVGTYIIPKDQFMYEKLKLTKSGAAATSTTTLHFYGA